MEQSNRGVIFLFICLAVLISSSAFAATITVTNANDSGSGSLRDAIASAVSGDTINFNLGPAATITLSSTLTIGTSLRITGPGATSLAISGNKSVRAFYVNSDVIATISGVTIRDGRADPSDFNGGGGILNEGGTLTLSDSTISGNSAAVGGGIANYGPLTVSNCKLSGNSAFYQGGGITNDYPTTIDHSTISGNFANYGGGIANFNYLLTITNSTLSGNSATAGFGSIYRGGGIYLSGGSVMVTNSTISGNSASAEGGGVFNFSGTLTATNTTLSGNSASGAGGGISTQWGTSAVMNSTLSGNQANSGGAIFNGGFTFAVSNSTLAGNFSNYGAGIYNTSLLTLKNTILASNSPGFGNNCFMSNPAISDGHNISDDYSCFLNGFGDLNSIPAGLDPSGLQDNGGPTQTIALRVNSPAVDAIPLSPTNYCTLPDGVTPVATDQRGVARPQVTSCDIGAYEVKPSSFLSFNVKLGRQGQGFAMNAAFSLGVDAAQIDPLTQAVRLQIGPYTVTIPAGSFHQAQGSNSGNWAYAGTISGTKLNVQISTQGGGSYNLNASGSPVDFSGLSNPIIVAIGIGLDSGSTQVTVNF